MSAAYFLQRLCLTANAAVYCAFCSTEIIPYIYIFFAVFFLQYIAVHSNLKNLTFSVAPLFYWNNDILKWQGEETEEHPCIFLSHSLYNIHLSTSAKHRQMLLLLLSLCLLMCVFCLLLVDSVLHHPVKIHICWTEGAKTVGNQSLVLGQINKRHNQREKERQEQRRRRGEGLTPWSWPWWIAGVKVLGRWYVNSGDILTWPWLCEEVNDVCGILLRPYYFLFFLNAPGVDSVWPCRLATPIRFSIFLPNPIPQGRKLPPPK